jgi:hypothetical protein
VGQAAKLPILGLALVCKERERKKKNPKISKIPSSPPGSSYTQKKTRKRVAGNFVINF